MHKLEAEIWRNTSKNKIKLKKKHRENQTKTKKTHSFALNIFCVTLKVEQEKYRALHDQNRIVGLIYNLQTCIQTLTI